MTPSTKTNALSPSKQLSKRTKIALAIFIFGGLFLLIASSYYVLIGASTGNWNKYSNEKFNFSILYPEKWTYDDTRFYNPYKSQGEKVAVGFGTELKPRAIGETRTAENSPTWGVYAMESVIDLEASIAFIGSDSKSRGETREDIQVGGVPAILITITRGQEGKRTLVVVIKNGATTYLISNGSHDNEDFVAFYNSFRLIK